MAASVGFPASPFLFQHVPSSPFLQRAKIRSPIPSVPDIDDRTASFERTMTYIPSASPAPLVPSTPRHYMPITPAPQKTEGMQTPLSEQVVPCASPFVGASPTSKREVRQLKLEEKSPKSAQTIDLFSGDDIFG